MFIHSKHQKLILQCYPPGKGVDKKPNPSELSYLLYYASTRRVKLEKVANFLEKKNTSDTNHNRAGNIQVTLAIFTALIEKCADDLNVFATHICKILLQVLKIGDLALCKGVLSTYSVFCNNLDTTLFPGDNTFKDSFKRLSETLINLGIQKSKAAGPRQLEWKMTALMASRHLLNRIGSNAKYSKSFVDICVPLYIQTIHNDTTEQSLLRRLNTNDASGTASGRRPSVASADHKLSKVASARQASEVYKNIDDDYANDSLTPADITEEAFRGLKTLFNTTSATQIAEITLSVVDYCNKNVSKPNWSVIFLQMCTTWIPVQLRFVTLTTLLRKLGQTAQKASSTDSKYAIQTQYANSILGLISSDVNMIGLSISDIIQQILSLQSGLFIHQSAFLSPEEVKSLSIVYSNCICNLSTHIYYYDQIPDSIQEILIKIDSVLEYSFLELDTVRNVRVSGDKIHKLIVTLLNNVSVMFDLLKKNSSNITRNHVDLEHWDISLPILAPESEFGTHTSTENGSSLGTPADSKTSEQKPPGRSRISSNATLPTNSLHSIGSSAQVANSSLTISQKNDIQRKYLRVFRDFLNNELCSETSDSSDSRESSQPTQPPKDYYDPERRNATVRAPYNKNKEFRNFALPDVNQYISIGDNFITRFLSYVDKFFRTIDFPNIENSLLIARIMQDMITILGVNFVNNFIPFFYHWLLPFGNKNPGNNFTQAAKYKDTIGHITMYQCLRSLDEMYPDEVDGYAVSSTFYSNVLIDIEFRKLNKFWIEGIDGEPSNEELIYNSRINSSSHRDEDGSLRFSATKKGLQEFIAGNSFTASWLNPHRPLINKEQFSSCPENGHSLAGVNSGATSGVQSINSTIGPGGNLSKIDDYGESIDDQATGNSFKNHTLGLGNANDITSIHSEIVHNHRNLLAVSVLNGTNGGSNGNANGTANGVTSGLFSPNEDESSIDLEPNYYNLPKVADLKESIYEYKAPTKKPSANETFISASTGHGSVLNKQMLSDVKSILDDLQSDDDGVVV